VQRGAATPPRSSLEATDMTSKSLAILLLTQLHGFLHADLNSKLCQSIA
jgi:hypothetical protein